MRKSTGPVINTRYETAAQVAKFKKAAKLCRWSLNSFVLFAVDRYATEVLSAQVPAQVAVQTPEAIQQPTE